MMEAMANPEEMIDVVDENDSVLYATTKREAHEKGLLHRTVISEIKDSESRWIMVKQASDKQDAGQYVSPVGGHVGAGETEDDALKREAQEECGIKDFDYKLIGKKIFNRAILNRQENHYFILYEIYSDTRIILNEESDSYRIFTESEMKDALKQTPEIFGAAFHFVVKTFYPELLTQNSLQANSYE
jgi:isopentenyl-diphosphate delta-isomerase